MTSRRPLEAIAAPGAAEVVAVRFLVMVLGMLISLRAPGADEHDVNAVIQLYGKERCAGRSLPFSIATIATKDTGVKHDRLSARFQTAWCAALNES